MNPAAPKALRHFSPQQLPTPLILKPSPPPSGILWREARTTQGQQEVAAAVHH